MPENSILIVGAGLSGLALATHLVGAGRDVTLIESRKRVGGRIYSPNGFDLGPAWIWPGQPRIAALTGRLGLKVFEQHWQGDLIYEDAQGPAHRGPGQASMRGALRVAGGLGAVTRTLAENLPDGVLRVGVHATGLMQGERGISVVTDGATIHADQVVLAIPPRLAASLTYTPQLSTAALAAMQAIPTWMAGHAKALARYDQPFWRAAGLSGDAHSRRGPMVEIHDASEDGGAGAIFGFMGIPASARRDQAALRDATLAQLGRLFGAEASTPLSLAITDWANDPLTATRLDQTPLTHHPTYGLPPALADLWDGALLLGSTEIATQFGGLVEGALEAAEEVFAKLRDR